MASAITPSLLRHLASRFQLPSCASTRATWVASSWRSRRRSCACRSSAVLVSASRIACRWARPASLATACASTTAPSAPPTPSSPPPAGPPWPPHPPAVRRREPLLVEGGRQARQRRVQPVQCLPVILGLLLMLRQQLLQGRGDVPALVDFLRRFILRTIAGHLQGGQLGLDLFAPQACLPELPASFRQSTILLCAIA